jgi:microcystin-dependent protein
MSVPFVGETRTFAFGFAPQGWMPCQGQLLPISENETLFMLLGTTFGGDGTETFALPKANGPVSGSVTLQMCISLFGVFPDR